MLKLIFAIFFGSTLLMSQVQSQLQEVTNQVFPGSKFKGFVAAFADINNDKHTDLFIVDQKKVSVLTGSPESTGSFAHLQTVSCNETKQISAVFPADYNADTFLDVIVTSTDDSVVSMYILFGTDVGSLSPNCIPLPQKLLDQPLLLDANADMIPDLIVTYENQTRQYLLGWKQDKTSEWDFREQKFITTDNVENLREALVPHSNAFVDLTGDGTVELVMSMKQNNHPLFEVWQSGKAGLHLLSTRNFTENLEVGQSVFVDFDGDSVQDHLLPVCEVQNGRCVMSKILMYKNDKWEDVLVSNGDFNFISKELSHLNQPITLVYGDFNQDSYIDFLCVTHSKFSDSSSTASVLYGKDCSADYCSAVGRQLDYGFLVPKSSGAFSAAFFDLGNDGNLDILVSIVATEESEVTYSLNAYKNTEAQDSCFLFVKSMSGSTKADTNVAGVTISYTTTDAKGDVQRTSDTQLSQTAHLSLQLPFVTFGLGRLPNFVDTLEVTVPSCLLPSPQCAETKKNSTATSKSWSMLIPNSKLFVVPSPPSDPSSWTNQLLVTPGRNVLTTLAVLLSICAAVFIAIVALHCVERRQDMRERIQEAHRFHFDAM